jgi:hypothetical protein
MFYIKTNPGLIIDAHHFYFIADISEILQISHQPHKIVYSDNITLRLRAAAPWKIGRVASLRVIASQIRKTCLTGENTSQTS